MSTPGAPLKPRISLVEEVVLLSLRAPRRRARRAARIAARAYPYGPSSRRRALELLRRHGLVKGGGLLRPPRPTPKAQIRIRVFRVQKLIRAVARLEGHDAELLTLLAAARALPLEEANDHMLAHSRVASIGQRGAELPRAVAELVRELGVTPGQQLADRVMGDPDQQVKSIPFMENYPGY